MTDVREQVTQAVLATVPTVELQPCRAGRQVEVVMYDEHLLGFDLPVTQCGSNRSAARIHEGYGLQQPDRLPADGNPGRLATQL